MKKFRLLTLAFCLVSITSDTLCLPLYNRKFDEFDFRDCISLIARLDNFAVDINQDKDSTGLIRIYGGRVVKRGEVQMYVSLVTNYLVQRRGVDSHRLKVVFSGYREKAGAEIYIVPSGAVVPRPYSPVSQRDVKFTAERADDNKYKCAKGPWTSSSRRR